MTAGKTAEIGCDYGKETRSTMFKLFTVLCTLLISTLTVACFAQSAAAGARKDAARLETGAATREDRWKQLDPRLERIEDKIDMLLLGSGGDS